MRGHVHAILYLTQDEEKLLCICIFVGPKRWKKSCPWGELRNICVGIQEAVLTGSGYLDVRPAQGCHFFQVRCGLFLYLGQDFYAKICRMNKPLGLPSKPVSYHSHFLQTRKQHFCKSSFVRCLCFSASFSYLLFCRTATWPCAAGRLYTHQVGLQVHIHFSLRFLKTLESMKWNRLLNTNDSKINVTLFHQAAVRRGEGRESNIACCRGHNPQVSRNTYYLSRFQAEKLNLDAFLGYWFSLLLYWIRQNAVFAPLLPLKISMATQSPNANLSYHDFFSALLISGKGQLRSSIPWDKERSTWRKS